ncbi:MAG: peptidase M15 [Muribaculaceae bacterium]|nr:peptidase M15 [Muribaculaceae bacterium]MBR5684884.1 peptidase M15 [Muribaculaceae bacterium]
MKYFTIPELIRSETARHLDIDNTPPASAVTALHALVDNVLDPLREAWGGPIRVNSGYRCPKLNRLVGGTPNSQHQRGEAADITVGSRSANRRLLALIKRLDLPVDQCIDEKGCRWIHVSHRPGHNRRLYMIF